jgi:site-specific recombinase XerD
MHVQEALQAFLLQLRADGRSEHTVRQYQRHGTSLANWLATNRHPTAVAKLTPEVLARFFADDAARNSCRGGPKKAVSLNAMRTSIRCFAQHLHDSGLVATNAARLLKRARCAPPPPKALRDDEQQRLLAVLAAATGREAERDRMLVEVLLRTGIRIGSALALDVGDIDFAHGEKGNARDRGTAAILSACPAVRIPAGLDPRSRPAVRQSKCTVTTFHLRQSEDRVGRKGTIVPMNASRERV